MCHKLDPVFFTRIAALDPADVQRRCLCGYNEGEKSYIVTFLEWEYRIEPTRRLIIPVRNDAREVGPDIGIVMLLYLLQAKNLPIEGNWVSEFALPGGSLFFRGPHRVRNKEVADRFGRDTAGFERACRAVGGEPIVMGDSAFRFTVLPRIPAAVVLWTADEEFEASAKLLFDASVREHLPLDVIFGMALELLGAILGKPLWG